MQRRKIKKLSLEETEAVSGGVSRIKEIPVTPIGGGKIDGELNPAVYTCPVCKAACISLPNEEYRCPKCFRVWASKLEPGLRTKGRVFRLAKNRPFVFPSFSLSCIGVGK